ncbi:MAG: HpcH/HpaI aldolase/citrate lyase family protein [Pseudomonadales bacterium]
MVQFPIWRSMLFVPAHLDKFTDKAHTRGAQAYILDLEDSVPVELKATARAKVVPAANLINQSGAAILVRINDSPRLAVRDLESVIDTAVRAIVLPKISAAANVQAISSLIDELEIEKGIPKGHTLMIAQIESADALPRLDEIAQSSTRLMAMILGSEDFSASVGMAPIPEALFAPNQQVLMACRRANILPLGFPASIADYSDLNRFRSTIELARKLGFVGAFCIHPSQVPILNDAFQPTAEEINEAREIIAAYERGREAGKAAVQHKGTMIDPPVVARAQEILLSQTTTN